MEVLLAACAKDICEEPETWMTLCAGMLLRDVFC